MNLTAWHVYPFSHSLSARRYFIILNSFPQPTELVLENDQAAINGIRSAGAKQLILAPGNGFTGGNCWTSYTGDTRDQPSSDFMNKLVDPLNNTAIDIHEVSCTLRS